MHDATIRRIRSGMLLPWSKRKREPERDPEALEVWMDPVELSQMLATREADSLTCDFDGLVALADEMHLDATLVFDPHGAMFEAGEIEVGSEFAVDVFQGIEIERRRDT